MKLPVRVLRNRESASNYRTVRAFAALSGLFSLLTLVAHAQTGWLARYKSQAAATQLNQPHWATPLITDSPRLQQGLRADFIRQTASDGTSTWNYGNSKGFQLIPLPRIEFRFTPPPFITHTNPRIADSFGDVAFRLKYRIYGSNEQHHNAIVTAVFAASLPTGKNTNGSCCAILTPSIEAGKGLGRFAATSALAATLPATNTPKLGRSVTWNNAVQYRLARLIWLQDEFNSTFYLSGKNNGKEQTFSTPGIVVGRFALQHPNDNAAPLTLSLGAGEQIALSHFHIYDHAPVFSFRLRF